MVQPTLWEGCGCLGEKSRSERAGGRHGGHAIASQDGYTVVPPVDLSQGGDPVFAWAAEIGGAKNSAPFPSMVVAFGKDWWKIWKAKLD